MSIGELARRAGLTPDALRAWERRYGLLKPRRTEGNRRLYSRVDEARVRLMQRYIEQGAPAAHAAEMAGAARLTVDVGTADSIPSHEVRGAHEDLHAALDAFRETEAQRVLERLFAAYSRVAVIGGVLLPYLRDIGDRWEHGHVTVAQEHFTSGFLEARFLAMARGWDRGTGPLALLACPAGERHVFGLQSFGIALHDLSWRIVCLGADTPLDMVLDAARAVSPDLVVLSAVAPERFPDTPAMRELTGAFRCALGGAGATSEIAEGLGALHLAHDAISAAREVYAT